METTLAGVNQAMRLRDMLTLAIVVISANLARTSLGPLQESMRLGLGMSDSQMALLQGPALAIPILVIALPLGLAIDRYSRIALLMALSLLDLAGTLGTALGTGFIALFCARCAVGAGSNASFTVVLSLVGDLCAPSWRGRATTVVSVSQVLGLALAFAIGGALLRADLASLSGWRAALLGVSVLLICAPLVILTMRDPRSPPATAARKPSDLKSKEAFRAIWGYRRVFLPLLAGLIAFETGLGAALTWAAPALIRRFSLPPERVALAMAVAFLISGVAGPLVGGLLADLSQRRGGGKLTLRNLATLGIMLAPCGMFPLAHSLAMALTLSVIFTILLSAACVAGTALFTVVIPSRVRGLSLAIMGASCIVFAVGAAPLIVSALEAVYGGTQMIGEALATVLVVCGVMGAFLYGLCWHYLENDLGREQEAA